MTVFMHENKKPHRSAPAEGALICFLALRSYKGTARYRFDQTSVSMTGPNPALWKADAVKAPESGVKFVS
ncbi:MAG: hypothetical protein ACU826_05190 [Gammaproteobacteria bacterium]